MIFRYVYLVTLVAKVVLFTQCPDGLAPIMINLPSVKKTIGDVYAQSKFTLYNLLEYIEAREVLARLSSVPR